MRCAWGGGGVSWRLGVGIGVKPRQTHFLRCTHAPACRRPPSQYHAGFRAQVAGWPSNPLDAIIREIRRTCPRGCVVADFGCGEARLAAELEGHAGTVHSFDLVRANARVTACDMARVPLPNACVDVAVFCLALMSTNYACVWGMGAASQQQW